MQLDDMLLFLFLPADRLDRLPKAVAAPADAVILDLEDAVAPDLKDAARSTLSGALDDAANKKSIIVRINGTDTEWCDKDADVVADLPVAAVMLPKCETSAQCERISRACGKPIIALVETAKGVHNAYEIARSARRLAFGNLDYAADLGLEQDPIALAHARSTLVLASRVAGIASPIDGVTKHLDAPDIAEADATHSRKMGFGGKLLIHPKQIEPARRAFRPTESDILWAERVLKAIEGGSGVATLEGQMIDAPVVSRARQLLARAGIVRFDAQE